MALKYSGITGYGTQVHVSGNVIVGHRACMEHILVFRKGVHTEIVCSHVVFVDYGLCM